MNMVRKNITLSVTAYETINDYAKNAVCLFLNF